MREVPRVQAGRRWMGNGYTATDDSGQMVRLMLLEMAPEIPHTLRRLKIPAFPTFDHGFDLGTMGSGRRCHDGEHVIRVRGLGLVDLDELGTRHFRGRIYSPKRPVLSGESGGRDTLNGARNGPVVLSLG
jgi:hypothetical protein